MGAQSWLGKAGMKEEAEDEVTVGVKDDITAADVEHISAYSLSVPILGEGLYLIEIFCLK